MRWSDNMEHNPGVSWPHKELIWHTFSEGGTNKSRKGCISHLEKNKPTHCGICFVYQTVLFVIQWTHGEARRWMVSCELLELLLCRQFFTIRSPSPPGVVPSCYTVDSREGGDILRHIPPRLCSLHPLVFFFFSYMKPTLLCCHVASLWTTSEAGACCAGTLVYKSALFSGKVTVFCCQIILERMYTKSYISYIG